jgi:WD40 repeat protein
VQNKSFTFPIENKSTIKYIALSPDGNYLLTIDGSGGACLISFKRRFILNRFVFKNGSTNEKKGNITSQEKRQVSCIKFSPNSKYFIATVGRYKQV